MTTKETRVSRRGLLRAAAGSATAVAAGTAATGAAAAQEYGGWFTSNAKGGAVDNYDGTTVDKTGQDQVTIQVGSQGNGGSFAFGPPAVRVSPGTKVTFEWVSNTHNVLVESQPDGAGWQGHEAIENQGFTYSHTFETKGIYKYYCQPHLSLGMKGAIVVGPAPGGGGGQGGGAPSGTVGGGISLWEVLFSGTILFGMLAPIIASFYRGEDVEVEYEPSTDADGEPTGTPEAPAEEPIREIGHDAYDPVGTASLVVVYFLILLGLWVFMYFVEFLGNGPTVIG